MSTTDLTIREGQTFWDDKQIATLRQLGVDRATNADLAVFFHQSVRTGLDPFARQIYMIERQGKQTIQTGIDGFRLVARRATDAHGGTLGYEDTQWCGEDGQWRDVWLSREAPAAARVTVIRDGQRYPAIALWTEYVATKRDGSITQMWATKPALMLAKCAEALALRKAFPQDLSGLYTADEMGQADNHRQQPTQRSTGRARLDAALEAHKPAPDAEPTDVTDAEVIDDERQPVLVSTQQLRALFAALGEAGVTEREYILAWLSELAGREITSTKTLTEDEASAAITAARTLIEPDEGSDQ